MKIFEQVIRSMKGLDNGMESYIERERENKEKIYQTRCKLDNMISQCDSETRWKQTVKVKHVKTKQKETCKTVQKRRSVDRFR